MQLKLKTLPNSIGDNNNTQSVELITPFDEHISLLNCFFVFFSPFSVSFTLRIHSIDKIDMIILDVCCPVNEHKNEWKINNRHSDSFQSFWELNLVQFELKTILFFRFRFFCVCVCVLSLALFSAFSYCANRPEWIEIINQKRRTYGINKRRMNQNQKRHKRKNVDKVKNNHIIRTATDSEPMIVFDIRQIYWYANDENIVRKATRS